MNKFCLFLHSEMGIKITTCLKELCWNPMKSYWNVQVALHLIIKKKKTMEKNYGGWRTGLWKWKGQRGIWALNSQRERACGCSSLSRGWVSGNLSVFKCYSAHLALKAWGSREAGSLVLSPNLECLLPKFFCLWNENSTYFFRQMKNGDCSDSSS